MKNKLSLGFWEYIANVVLRNRKTILFIIATITVLLATQWKHIHFTYSEANLLPDDHEINIQYNAFLKEFGEEGNLIVIGSKDQQLFTPKAFKEWAKLMEDLKKQPEVDLVVSVDDIKKLQKNDNSESFELTPFFDPKKVADANYLKQTQTELFTRTPFYEGLLFNKKK